MTSVVVIADTHTVVNPRKALPLEVWRAIERADAVLHAGDVMTDHLLDALAEHAPVHTVLGNNDYRLYGRLPQRLTASFEGVSVGMVHDLGIVRGDPVRAKSMFPEADVVVFGHTHLPEDVEGLGSQRLFNPGSPTQRRRARCHTYGVLRFCDGAIVERRVVEID